MSGDARVERAVIGLQQPVSIWVALMLLIGCSNTHVVGHLELVEEPVLLDLPPGAFVGSIGLLDDQVLVTVTTPALDAGEEWGPEASDVTAQWFDENNERGEAVYLGRAPTSRVQPRWVRVATHLTGAVWITSDPAAAPEITLSKVAVWSLSREPPATECSSRPMLADVLSVFDYPNIQYSGAAGVGGAGVESHAPGARLGDEFVALGYAIPQLCRRPVAWRLFGITADPSSCESSLRWNAWSDLCADVDDRDNVGTLAALTVGPSEVGVFFRPTFSSDARLRWIRINEAGETTRPAEVGAVQTLIGFDAGGAPAAARVGDAVVFSEREQETAECHMLRVMNLDGTSARDAPWQPGCSSRRDGRLGPWWSRIQAVPELLPIATSAGSVPVGVFVYSDLPQHRIDDPSQAPGRVVAVALTEDGRRASEPVLLGGPDSVISYYYRAASDGDDVAIVYLDVGEATPGWHLARLRWVPN